VSDILIDRLTRGGKGGAVDGRVARLAADEIERLRAEVADLRADAAIGRWVEQNAVDSVVVRAVLRRATLVFEDHV
jgi:hypothetical protein